VLPELKPYPAPFRWDIDLIQAGEVFLRFPFCNWVMLAANPYNIAWRVHKAAVLTRAYDVVQNLYRKPAALAINDSLANDIAKPKERGPKILGPLDAVV
jgi:hypothetical protein